ncbi:MAG: hypothetical protein Q8L07_03240 [Sediminibacterium sp.]|nr:hypothetical protein [Sediminibacterium sp.]
MSCSKSEVATPAPIVPNLCSTINAKFSADISVIVQTNCATNSSCHAAGSVNGPGPLLNFTQINANASAIKTQVESKLMPKGATLSQADIDKIKCWVNSGALNN